MAGAIMMVFGCLGKFSALAVSMPDPIIGASFLVLFGKCMIHVYKPPMILYNY